VGAGKKLNTVLVYDGNGGRKASKNSREKSLEVLLKANVLCHGAVESGKEHWLKKESLHPRSRGQAL